MELGEISARGVDKVVRVAWTLVISPARTGQPSTNAVTPLACGWGWGSDHRPRPAARRASRSHLSAEPGDPVLAALLDVSDPAGIVAAVAAGRPPAWPLGRLDGGQGDAGQRDGVPLDAGQAAVQSDERVRRTSRTEAARLEHAFGTWRNRLGSVPAEMDLARFHRDGIRLVCPGEPDGPQPDTLGAARPYALWLRGEADLRYCCLRSVSIVGARAATAYGAHVCTEMAAALGERGWTVISGGAYTTKTQHTLSCSAWA